MVPADLSPPGIGPDIRPSVRPDTVLRPSRDVRWRHVDGEAVVVRQRAAEVLVMNEVASRLLALADGRTPVAGWIDVLAREYDADRETVERDVLAFAAELAAEGMLEIAPPSREGSDGV
jgi:hypothetical protein